MRKWAVGQARALFRLLFRKEKEKNNKNKNQTSARNERTRRPVKEGQTAGQSLWPLNMDMCVGIQYSTNGLKITKLHLLLLRILFGNVLTHRNRFHNVVRPKDRMWNADKVQFVMSESLFFIFIYVMAKFYGSIKKFTVWPLLLPNIYIYVCIRAHLAKVLREVASLKVEYIGHVGRKYRQNILICIGRKL